MVGMRNAPAQVAPWWWFAAAFFAALGALAAFKGVEWVEREWAAAEATEAARATEADTKKRSETASRFILNNLQKKGIVSLSDEALGVTVNDLTGETFFIGRGLDSKGVTHDIRAMWRVAKFGGKSVWACEWIVMDDRPVYRRESEPPDLE